tara:strand:- start:7522 stop:7989 length:468 start_codon:yes stop_codon:yes gene_type:complete
MSFLHSISTCRTSHYRTSRNRTSRYTPISIGLISLLLACSGGSSDSGEESNEPGADGGVVVTTADGGGDDEPQTRSGLAGFCDHYFTCGGSYYASTQDCIDASIDYWGDCRQATLDAFGDCMMGIDCSDWNPDAYNPASTDCSEEWSDVEQAPCD